MNIDGSSSKVIFDIKPSSKIKWHVNQIVLSMTDDTDMDSGKFGGIAALTKGIIVRRKNSVYFNTINAKTNGGLDLKGFVVKYDPKAPSVVYGMTATKIYNSQQGAGCAILVDGNENEKLQIIIQDNLTGLSSFNTVII
ncbi:MAG TPA: hypothetical protein PK957_03080 [Candidatus Dojkabacteria bacterium]|nr:hypothetical protein [Candidatus Dojkabacteria bacterium]